MYTKDEVSNGTTTKVRDLTSIKSTQVYLPANTTWYDFWTNKKMEGGQAISKETPMDIIPLYVKAGAIIPMGPKVQYAEEKNWDNLEIRVYTGKDGTFELYEDENDNYNYEKGASSLIQFKWDEVNKKLTIAERKGTFDGMLKSRNFKIVFINSENTPIVKTISYNGKAVKIVL